jgi:hypothetical protein
MAKFRLLRSRFREKQRFINKIFLSQTFEDIQFLDKMYEARDMIHTLARFEELLSEAAAQVISSLVK